MTLYEVKKEVCNWIETIQGQYKNKLNIEAVTDCEELYWVIVETENCMAEIVINEPTFAPYRYVSFEVAAIVENKASLIYWWYDDETHTLQDIINTLDKGVKFAVDY